MISNEEEADAYMVLSIEQAAVDEPNTPTDGYNPSFRSDFSGFKGQAAMKRNGKIDCRIALSFCQFAHESKAHAASRRVEIYPPWTNPIGLSAWTPIDPPHTARPSSTCHNVKSSASPMPGGLPDPIKDRAISIPVATGHSFQ